MLVFTFVIESKYPSGIFLLICSLAPKFLGSRLRDLGSDLGSGIPNRDLGSRISDPNLESDTAKFFSHSHFTIKLPNVIMNFLCLFSYKPPATKIGGAVLQKVFSSLLESFQSVVFWLEFPKTEEY